MFHCELRSQRISFIIKVSQSGFGITIVDSCNDSDLGFHHFRLGDELLEDESDGLAELVGRVGLAQLRHVDEQTLAVGLRQGLVVDKVAEVPPGVGGQAELQTVRSPLPVGLSAHNGQVKDGAEYVRGGGGGDADPAPGTRPLDICLNVAGVVGLQLQRHLAGQVTHA